MVHFEDRMALQYFKQSHVGFECCFVFITFSNSDVVISGSHVHFRKESGISYFIHQFLDEGKRIAIGDGEGIKLPVVDHWSGLSVLSPSKEEWGGVLRL
jgi:hypothetical protein